MCAGNTPRVPPLIYMAAAECVCSPSISKHPPLAFTLTSWWLFRMQLWAIKVETLFKNIGEC